MMRSFTLALACALSLTGHAAPLAAEETPQPMTPETCLSGWQTFTFMASMPGRLRAIQPAITPTGWCRIDKSNGDVRDNDFTSVEWRATGVREAVSNRGMPLDFEADFEGISLVKGLKMPLGPLHQKAMGALRIKAARVADTNDFLVEQFIFDFEDLGAVSFTLKGDGIDLSSLERMQLTLGGMRIKSLGLRLETTSDLSRVLRPIIEEPALLREWARVLQLMPSEIFTEGSQDALLQFVQAMPAANGTLQLQIGSETGLGFLQIFAGANALEAGKGSVFALADAVEQLMTGATIDATWTPGS